AGAYHRHAPGTHDLHQLLRAREQGLEHTDLHRALAHRTGQVLFNRSTRSALGELLLDLERADLQRRQAPEKLTRHPDLLRNTARTGVVQATDESPEAVANDERNAHGRVDSHVGHVFE